MFGCRVHMVNAMQDDAAPAADGAAGTRYILDVLLYCAKPDAKPVGAPVPVPCKEGQKGEMVVRCLPRFSASFCTQCRCDVTDSLSGWSPRG